MVSFPGVKRPRRDADHPLSSNAEVKERVEVYLYSPSGAAWSALRVLPVFYLVPNNYGEFCDVSCPYYVSV